MDIYFIVSFVFIFSALMEFVLVLLDTGVKRQRQNNNNDMESNNKVKSSAKVQNILIVFFFIKHTVQTLHLYTICRTDNYPQHL